MKQLQEATIEALRQVQQLVVASDGNRYNQPSENSESGIGKHIRHILDHFLALEQGIINNHIDYNCRHRESEIENDAELALQLIKQLIKWLRDSHLADRKVTVESEISLKQQQNQCFDSSLSRELCYLINHTVHHVAYTKLVAKELGIVVDETIGIAPSTATYLRQQGQ